MDFHAVTCWTPTMSRQSKTAFPKEGNKQIKRTVHCRSLARVLRRLQTRPDPTRLNPTVGGLGLFILTIISLAAVGYILNLSEHFSNIFQCGWTWADWVLRRTILFFISRHPYNIPNDKWIWWSTVIETNSSHLRMLTVQQSDPTCIKSSHSRQLVLIRSGRDSNYTSNDRIKARSDRVCSRERSPSVAVTVASVTNPECPLSRNHTRRLGCSASRLWTVRGMAMERHGLISDVCIVMRNWTEADRCRSNNAVR